MDYGVFEWLQRIEAKLDFLLTKLQEEEEQIKKQQPKR